MHALAPRRQIAGVQMMQVRRRCRANLVQRTAIGARAGGWAPLVCPQWVVRPEWEGRPHLIGWTLMMLPSPQPTPPPLRALLHTWNIQEAHQIGAYKAVTAAARAANVTLEFGQETVSEVHAVDPIRHGRLKRTRVRTRRAGSWRAPAAGSVVALGQTRPSQVLDFCGRVARTSAKNMIWATGRALCQAVPGFTKK